MPADAAVGTGEFALRITWWATRSASISEASPGVDTGSARAQRGQLPPQAQARCIATGGRSAPAIGRGGTMAGGAVTSLRTARFVDRHLACIGMIMDAA
jgi:hypothetical protein